MAFSAGIWRRVCPVLRAGIHGGSHLYRHTNARVHGRPQTRSGGAGTMAAYQNHRDFRTRQSADRRFTRRWTLFTEAVPTGGNRWDASGVGREYIAPQISATSSSRGCRQELTAMPHPGRAQANQEDGVGGYPPKARRFTPAGSILTSLGAVVGQVLTPRVQSH